MTAATEMEGDSDLASLGAALAEPARARVILALADGRPLPASTLAAEAGVSPATMSAHLRRLLDAGLVTVTASGRYRYYTLAGPQVGELVETLARLAPRQRVTSLREGTRAHAIRLARRCYDHLAGRLGVAVTDALLESGVLAAGNGGIPVDQSPGLAVPGPDPAAYLLTDHGRLLLAGLGVTLPAGPVVGCCIDWTERRHHVAGPLGRALLARFDELAWLRRSAHSRAVHLTDVGREQLPATLGVRLPTD